MIDKTHKIRTSKSSERSIIEIVELLGLEKSNYLIARLAISISLILGLKVNDIETQDDSSGKEFNEYTLFQNNGYDYKVVITTLLSNLYGHDLTDEELLGKNGLIRRHINLGCQVLDNIYEATKPSRNRFLRKLYSLKFDNKLLEDFRKETKSQNQITNKYKINTEINNNKFVNVTIERVKQFLVNLGYEVLKTEYILSSSVLRIKIKFPPLNKSIQEIKRRSDDLKLYLELNTDPLISVFNGFLCIDVPRPEREFVYLMDIINRIEYKSPVTFPLGMDTEGEIVSMDLSDSSTPHLLIGGATGQGKSELLKSIIVSLTNNNKDNLIELYLVDPKKVEFTRFSKLPTVKNIITEVDKTISLLSDLATEMNKRYDLLNQYEVNNIDAYNKLSHNKKPHVVVIFDEFADFMLNEKEIRQSLENEIKKLSGKARAAGIHLILATQRPDSSIITGIVKANLPAKIAFKTTTGVNSNVVIDSPDAKDLLGKGDMILVKDSSNIRIQSAYLPDEDLNRFLSKY